jgi:hypothetical protein
MECFRRKLIRGSVMRYVAILVCGLPVIAVVAISAAQETSPELKGAACHTLEKLKSQEYKVRAGAVAAFREDRKACISSLLKIAQSEKKWELLGARELAIMLLGEIRAVEAVPFLLANMEFRVPHLGQDDGRLEYPCAGALIAIGAPAYPKIWGRLESDMSELEQSLLAYSARKIDGDELALVRLESVRKEAVKRNASERQIRNLDKLIELCRTRQKGF